MGDHDAPFAQLERDERDSLLSLEIEARWLVRVFKILLAVSSVLGAAWMACTLLIGFDFPGRWVLKGCSRVLILAVIIWLPMLVVGLAWSARNRVHRTICYAIAVALFSIVVIGTPWLLANAM